MMHADPLFKSVSAPVLRKPQAVNILFLSVCPLALWLLRGSPTDVLTAVVLIAIFACARALLIRGLLAAEIYEDSSLRHPPALPCKLFGSALLGVAITALAAYRLEALLQPIIFGFVTFTLSVLVFGRDPGHANLTFGARATSESSSSAKAMDQIADDLQAIGRLRRTAWPHRGNTRSHCLSQYGAGGTTQFAL